MIIIEVWPNFGFRDKGWTKSHHSCKVQARTKEVIWSQNQAGKKKFMSKNEFGYWNDRRSRCVFLCFYSAIFQLTSAKFQTFAYTSRTVGSIAT